jgi:hypothetical protein
MMMAAGTRKVAVRTDLARRRARNPVFPKKPGFSTGVGPVIGVLVVGFGLLASTAAAEELIRAGQPYAVRQLLAVSHVSDQFRRQTEAASASIPNQVWNGLEQAGWQVQLAEFVVDAIPSLRGTQPRGWPAGTTWENTDAVHLPTSRLLVLAEKRRNNAGGIVASSRVEGVLRHEIGHAFDMATGGGARYRSSASQFLTAYHHDVGRVTAADRAALAYYLQDDKAGRQETFAEAFAIVLGGGSDPPHHEAFVRSFPNVLNYLRWAIDNYQRGETAAR